MNREDIIRMAHEAGIKGPAPARQGFKMYANPQRLMTFAALVAAAERAEVERLRALCEEMSSELFVYRASENLKDVTAAIRARGHE